MMRMDRWIEPINKYGRIDESVENSVEVILVLQARSIQICFGGLGGRFQIIQKWKEEREGEGGRKKGEKSISNLSQVQKQTQVLYF